jgi:hypothetical protein
MTGDRYYVAVFNAWGKALVSEVDIRTEMRVWCTSVFGKSGTLTGMGQNSPRWVDDILWGEVYLLNEKDLTLFLLKWAT